jgi:hypothetical protein
LVASQTPCWTARSRHVSAQAFVAASSAEVVTARERALGTDGRSPRHALSFTGRRTNTRPRGLVFALARDGRALQKSCLDVAAAGLNTGKETCRKRMLSKTVLANSEGPVRHIATNCLYWPHRRREEERP